MFEVIFEPNRYHGSYWIRSLDGPSEFRWGPFAGAFKRGYCQLPQGRYAIWISPGAEIEFSVDGAGRVDAHGAAGLRCSGSVVEFVTCPVVIEPSGYPGTFLVEGVEPSPGSGSRSYNLLVGIESILSSAGYILRLEHSNVFRFSVSPVGEVSLNSHYSGAGVANGNKLIFNVVDIEIVPIAFDGEWAVLGAEKRPAPGRRTLPLVPDVKGYILSIAPGSGERFDIDAQGLPSVNELLVPDGATRERLFGLAKK